jgi:hypothetical protein
MSNTIRSSSCLNAAVLLAAGLAIGCGGDGGNRVTGKVTFKGQPVPAGKVYFKADGAKGNTGQAGYASISNGSYDTSGAGGQAAPTGAVVIEVEGIDPNPPPGADPDVTTTLLFSGYTKQVELPAGSSVQDIDVPESAAQGPAQPAATPVIVP